MPTQKMHHFIRLGAYPSLKRRAEQEAKRPPEVLSSEGVDSHAAEEIAQIMRRIRTDGTIQCDLDPVPIDSDLIREPAPMPETSTVMEQVRALAQLMLNANALDYPALPARSLGQRLKLVWSTLSTIAGATKGEVMCVVAGDFFPGHHGDFEAIVVANKWDALRITIGGLAGFVLRGELSAGHAEDSVGSLATLPVDEPSRVHGSFTRNNLFQLFGKRGGADVVIHAGSTAAARQCLGRHYLGLTRAAQVLGGSSGLLIPEVLQFSDVRGIRLLVQSAIAGRLFDLPQRTEADIQAKVELVIEVIATTFAKAIDPHVPPEGEFLTDPCERMRQALADAYIADVIDQARAWQAQTTIGSALCHGDLWFPNIVFPSTEASAPSCIGLIDWEWARPDGVPGYDALHLVALVLAEVCRIPLGSAFRMVGHPERLPGWLRSIVTSIARIYGLEREDLEAISRLLLLIRIWQGHFVTYSGGEKWLTDLVRAYRDVNP